MQLKNKPVIDNFELVFKIIYLAFGLLSFNSFTARQGYISYISYAVVLLGAVVIVLRLTHLKDYLNRNVYLLIALIVAYGISSLSVIRYGIMENIQGMVWMGLQYFAVFAFDVTKDKEKIKKEFDYILIFFFVYTFIMCIAGLVMMFIDFGFYKMVDEKYIIAGGFIWNRLYGCYMDPNYGAVFSILSILTSIYFFKKTDKKFFRIVLVINVVCEYWHFACSDSRTGLVAIFASFAALTFLILKQKGKKLIVALLAAAIVGSVLALGAVGVQKGTGYVRTSIATIKLQKAGLSEEEIALKLDETRIGRTSEEINDGDVSNNRFAIWSAGLDIFAEHPIIGISFRNIIEYVDAEKTDSFIHTSGYESMHNSFVDILVSQGIVGMLIVLALIASVFIALFKRYKEISEPDYPSFLLAFSGITAIFASMMFYSESFYMNTGGAFLFWYFLGYIFNYLIPISSKKGE